MSFGPSGIQQALFDRLKASTLLRDALGLAAGKNGIFDCIPQDQPYPFISFSDQSVKDWDAHDFTGFESEVVIHTWTRGSGRAYAWSVMSVIHALLHRYSLQVAGYSTVVCRCTFQTVLVEQDNVTYHGVQKFKIVIG